MQNGHADCVHAPLPGADTDAVDSVGRTAAALSQANAHADCLAALNDARRSERFMRVASRGNSGGSSSSGGTWLTASPNDSPSRSPSSPDGSGVAFLTRGKRSVSEGANLPAEAVGSGWNRQLLRRASNIGSRVVDGLPEAPRLRMRESINMAQRRFQQTVQAATDAREKALDLQAQAHEALAQERRISTARLYLLTAATLLLVVVVLYFLVVAALKFLARVEVVWFFSRSAKLDDFRRWTQEVCMESWQRESVLCQAVEGNWLARELVRAKLQQAGVPHCDPSLVTGGCVHTPCRSKGLSSKLLELRDAWSSPLNNRLSPLYYVLLPVRTRVRELLKRLARGDMPLSQLKAELDAFPLLQRHFAFLPRMSRDETNKMYILNEFAYPALRDWGVLIGGSTPKPPKANSCAEPFAPLVDGLLERLDEKGVTGGVLTTLWPPNLAYAAAGRVGSALSVWARGRHRPRGWKTRRSPTLT